MRLFAETQRFNQWWVLLLQWASVGFLLYAFYQWFIMDTAVGNVASTDTTGQFILVISLVGTLVLLLVIQLKTEIDEVGIHFQFRPFHFRKKTILWEQMESCSVRKYNPIMEYGGWGYRISLKNGKAYNVRGNIGIQIVQKSGKKVLLGTQKEAEIQEIISQCLKKYKNT